jgi:RNA-directed DNA polymerase
MERMVRESLEAAVLHGRLRGVYFTGVYVGGKYRRVKNGRTYWQSKHNKVTKVNLIRYADDFVITGASRELLENEVKPMVCNFLSQRGLTLSESKTRITNIENGFDFLGFNIRKYDTKLLIKPSKKSVKRLLCRIRGLV